MTVDVRSRAFSADALDLDRLLQPIPGDSPRGESLRYEGTYDLIQEARRADDPTLPQGVWKTDLKKADWKQVAELSLAALEERTKDLQIAAWLLEAWLKLHGLAGVEAGFRVMTGLCETFWDDMFPQLEDGDLEARVAPLEWVNEKVTLELKRVPMTEADTGEGRAYAWLDWESALYSAEARAAEIATQEGTEERDLITRSKFMARVSLTPTRFYRQQARALAGAGEALAALDGVLHERCGDDAPSLSQFREVLAEMTGFVGRVLEERQELEPPEEMPMSEPAEAPPAAAEEAMTAGGEAPTPATRVTISSRAEAYRLLAQAADYLMRTEPHSPSPYLVRRAISWGGMSLADVLKELLRNNADLPTVYTMLGIRQSDEE